MADDRKVSGYASRQCNNAFQSELRIIPELQQNIVSNLRNQVCSLQGRITTLERENNALKQDLERAKEYALIDHLTGAYNVRFLDIVVKRRITTEFRAQRSWGIIMFDIDKFKDINDTYGHAHGDVVLTNTVKMIQHLSRKGDFVVRNGGDEFVVIMFDITEDALAQLAERYRKALESMSNECHCANVRITASIGACFVPSSSAMVLEQVLNCADKALYQSKEQGRNQVTVARDNRVRSDV